MANYLCLLVALLFLNGGFAETKLQPLESKEVTLEPFSAISDCLPFNVKVEPSKVKDVYAVSIEGEKSLVKAISAKVRNGVLSLSLKRAFETERIIKVIVQVPRDMLDTIMKTSTSVLVVAPGLKTKELTIMTSGVAAVRVFDANINDLVVEANGSSVVFAEGKIKQARLDVGDTAKTYVYGVTTNAEVFANSIGHIYIQAANKNVEVDGRVEGLGRVHLNKGTCSVDGTFFRSGCQTLVENAMPTFEATYSCGLVVNGKITCDNDGTSSTYTSSRVDHTTGSSFVSSSTSTKATSSGSSTTKATSSGSGTAKATASGSSTVRTSSTVKSSGGTSFASSGEGTTTTSTSHISSSSSSVGGGHHFESVVSTTGDDAESVAVATAKCLDEDIEMFEQT